MTLSNRQHDAIEAAREAARERMTSPARGSISPPMVPQGLLDSLDAAATYYDEAEPVVTEKLDGPAVGTPEQQDAWAQITMSPEAVARRDAERQALDELDQLRLMALERDAVEVPRPNSEPVRADLSWRAGLP